MNYFSLKGIHSTGMWHLPKPSLVSGESLMYQLRCLYGTVPCLQWNKFFLVTSLFGFFFTEKWLNMHVVTLGAGKGAVVYN